ncbi:hypothetical protein DEU56DRAFT_917982 [Suillus clintonianus]|uniref:uncharacterized protein n=1 Tax=Suillus clintonianus TaxID=1904413 RepID=UPI001B885CD1|nr:uncharacterized protein DEU56DRAFT_917982 [Suillus clintonianus]KAG2121984.1 hypothetical protein DEU56DRAFT_917982 [Suillus clintonianus]
MPRGRPPKRPALEREQRLPLKEHTAANTLCCWNSPRKFIKRQHIWIDDRVEHPSDCQFEDETLTDDIVDICSTEKRKETAADRPLLAWIGQRQIFLDEMLRLNGRGTEGVTCSCGAVSPQFRCCDCHGIQIFCRECTLQNHVLHPLHRIEIWNGTFFQRITLKQLGVRVQLGHNPGERCYKPSPAAGDDFVVIALDGIHEIALDFVAALRLRFVARKVHRQFRVSSESGIVIPLSCGWYANGCNLKQLSRGGRGHDPAGVNATAEGELAVLCPACPQPGKNLPLDWEKEPLFTRWKYALFVAIDANFRLKRKAVSSDTADPSLNAGWAYFVHEDSYKSYLADRASDKQETFSVAKHVFLPWLAATGVGTIDCARHDMKLPNGVGDLQKGEQYINMDYIMCSALFILAMSMINIILRHRLPVAQETLDSNGNECRNDFLPPANLPSYIFFVPKFHIQAHIDECRTNFSFNWSRYVGRTDGEAPERGWSNINRVASSTKEMGPGARRDTLDDHFGDWNWKKITALGRTLHKKMIEAVKWTKEHSEALWNWRRLFSRLLSRSGRQRWNPGRRITPLRTPLKAGLTASVRLQLTELEAQDLQAGINVSLHTDVSPSGLITSGMDLEDQQARLRSSLANVSLHDTDNQKAITQTQIASLQRRLDAWARIQELYMPVVCQLRHRSSEASGRPQELKPEDFNLWLPSQLPAGTPVDLTLAGHEWELRYAQALDALNEVRSHLRLRSHMYKYKDKNVRGQAGSTRAKKIIDAVESRKHASVLKYRRARSALLSLGHRLEKCGWELTMRPLLDSDVKPMGDMEQQGRGTISWIWLDSRADNSCTENERIQDCVRLEWCKARARDTGGRRRWSYC